MQIPHGLAIGLVDERGCLLAAIPCTALLPTLTKIAWCFVITNLQWEHAHIFNWKVNVATIVGWFINTIVRCTIFDQRTQCNWIHTKNEARVKNLIFWDNFDNSKLLHLKLGNSDTLVLPKKHVQCLSRSLQKRGLIIEECVTKYFRL